MIQQMICLFAQANVVEMWRLILFARKSVVCMLILICFGGTLIICNKDIPVCGHQLEELKKDVKEWKQRCTRENGDEIISECCKTEKAYNQKRMRTHTKMCFYKGSIHFSARKASFN